MPAGALILLAYFLTGTLTQSRAEDLTATEPSLPAEEEISSPDIFDMVDSHEARETDWRLWPIDTEKGRAASLETTVLHVIYPYQDQKFHVYVYQLPNGGAGRPWVTYVWIDRGSRFRTENISPTPAISCEEYDADRWRGIEDISKKRWKEINRISSKISSLPLEDNGKKVKAKRILITQRKHPYPAKLARRGGVATIHQLVWVDGTHLATVPSSLVQKPK